MVFEVRDLWPNGPIAMGALRGRGPIAAAKWLEKFAYDNSAAIVALAPSIKSGIVARGYPPEQVHIIPNSSDIELFQVPQEYGEHFRNQCAWLGNRPLVLYAGTVGRVNGVEYLAEIAAILQSIQAEIRFLIVGDGAMGPMVRERAHTLGILDKSFFMMGKQPKSEMPRIFAAATITTSTVIDLPALWADSANKFFDSLAAGRPIAINYGGWQAELIHETGCGVVLPAADAPVAAALLSQVLGSPAFLKQSGAAALTLARTRFDRNILARQLAGVLQQSVDEHRIDGAGRLETER